MLLMFRMGDLYELYDDDAVIGAKLLGLTLTMNTQKGTKIEKLAMAAFPHEHLEQHLRLLLQSGQQVVVCEMEEESAAISGEGTLFDFVESVGT